MLSVQWDISLVTLLQWKPHKSPDEQSGPWYTLSQSCVFQIAYVSPISHNFDGKHNMITPLNHSFNFFSFVVPLILITIIFYFS